MKNLLILIIVLAIIAIGGFIAYQQFGQSIITEEFVGAEPINLSETTEDVPIVNGVPDFSEAGPVADAVQRENPISISYTDSGFVPNEIKVRSGAVVTFVNNSSRAMWVASAIHPYHQDLPGFDQLQSVGRQGSYSFTFIKAGNWKYHNHVNPGDGGIVIVE